MTNRNHKAGTSFATMLMGIVAFVAMAVQVAFYADHIGASAVRATGLADPGARFGFLEICTGDGIELVDANGLPVNSSSDCPICENAAMGAFAGAMDMPLPNLPLIAVEMVLVVPSALSITDQKFPGTQPIRGPPDVA